MSVGASCPNCSLIRSRCLAQGVIVVWVELQGDRTGSAGQFQRLADPPLRDLGLARQLAAYDAFGHGYHHVHHVLLPLPDPCIPQLGRRLDRLLECRRERLPSGFNIGKCGLLGGDFRRLPSLLRSLLQAPSGLAAALAVQFAQLAA